MYLKKLSIIFITLITFNTILFAQERGDFLGGKDSVTPNWFLNSFLDLQEDIDELRENNKRLMLYIHQDNCPYCHLFINKNLKNKKTKKLLQDSFGVVSVNMFGNKEITDIDEEVLSEKDFALKYKIQFTPTLIFYNELGEQVLRLNGYQNTKNFNLALDYIKNKREKLISFKKYISQNERNAILISEPDIFKNSKNLMRVNTTRKMAIFFESANCQECEILHNKLLKDKITRNLLKTMDVYQVDMNSSSSVVTPQRMITKIKDWTETLNITHTPTVIFFDENANEIIRIESMFKNFHFQTVVDYVVSNSYKEEKEFQRYLTKRANKLRDDGIDVNIWE